MAHSVIHYIAHLVISGIFFLNTGSSHYQLKTSYFRDQLSLTSLFYFVCKKIRKVCCSIRDGDLSVMSCTPRSLPVSASRRRREARRPPARTTRRPRGEQEAATGEHDALSVSVRISPHESGHRRARGQRAVRIRSVDDEAEGAADAAAPRPGHRRGQRVRVHPR